MKKIVLTFGIIAGIIVSGTLFFMFSGHTAVDMKNGKMLGYSSMIIAFSTIFIAVKNYRDNHLAGSIKFGKAFLVGLYITLVASTLYVARGW